MSEKRNKDKKAKSVATKSQDQSSVTYEGLWRNKWLTSKATSIQEMSNMLFDAGIELLQMRKDGVKLDPGSGIADDYATLITDNKAIADKYGFQVVDGDD